MYANHPSAPSTCPHRRFAFRTATWQIVCLLAASVFFGGCRTYGGFGSESATYDQIQRAVHLFGEELARAEVDAQRLTVAADEHASLRDAADQFADVLRMHEATLEEQRELAAAVSPGDPYRDLNRAYGAIVSQQHTAKSHYQSVLRGARDMLIDVPIVERRPYAVIPPYYHRVSETARPLSVGDLTALVRRAEPTADDDAMLQENATE